MDAEVVLTVGVIADTHVPDRRRCIPGQLIPALRSHNVDLILHAGDITSPRVLRRLEQIAPVIAVRGNRDVLFIHRLPLIRRFELAGVRIVMTHGHGNWRQYWLSKLMVLLKGHRNDWFLPQVAALSGGAEVVIFGHTHCPMNEWMDGILVFNPGSPGVGVTGCASKTYGILEIFEGGRVRAEIKDLGDEQTI
ncbi:MAG: metallophosphoesterase [Anaerolineaceae bacterium]|nr:metallophosphoesterase [Anaerolineaceae bacterium]